jgi:hypothetical protein
MDNNNSNNSIVYVSIVLCCVNEWMDGWCVPKRRINRLLLLLCGVRGDGDSSRSRMR